jgi:glycosyltransferase involved in cell wall biosynthesis
MPDAFIVAGARVREYYLGRVPTGKPIFEIQAPVDCAAFDPRKFVTSQHLSSSKLNVVLVGNVNPIKGIEYFIEMVSKLNQVTWNTFEFYIVGPVYESQSNYARRLNALVECKRLDNVHFLGPTKDVRSILNAADIYVCSSVAEASPTAVWEAMSMAKAIVSTDVGDVRRFLVDGVVGYVVPTRNSDELARAVGSLGANAELRAQFGRKAREVALKHLDIAICAERHLQTYAGLIKESHSSVASA